MRNRLDNRGTITTFRRVADMSFDRGTKAEVSAGSQADMSTSQMTGKSELMLLLTDADGSAKGLIMTPNECARLGRMLMLAAKANRSVRTH